MRHELVVKSNDLGCCSVDGQFPEFVRITGVRLKRMRLGLVAAATGLALLTGCGGSSHNTVTQSATGDFSLEVAPTTISMTAGSSQSVSIGVTPTNGFTGTVSVSLGTLPAGVTATPATLSLVAGTFGQISLSSSASATAGTTPIAVSGTSGSLTHSGSSSLTIGAAAPADFALEVAPSTISMPAGGTQALSVGVMAVNGFTGTVSVSLANLPTGVTASPATLSLSAGTIGQFSLTSSTSTAAATTAISVNGSSGSLTHSGSSSLTVSAAATPDFSLQVAPTTITIPAGGTRSLSVGVTSLNGFTGAVSISLANLPAGVTATPSTLSVMPGSIGQFSLSSLTSATAATTAVSVTGVAGSLSHSGMTSLIVGAASTTSAISSTAFNFGNDLVGNTVTQAAVTVNNTGAGILTLNPSLTGDASFTLAPSSSSSQACGTLLAAGASCNVMVSYTPTAPSAPSAQSTTLNLGLDNVQSGAQQTVAITGTSGTLSVGTVAVTNNPQVALYTMNLPFPGSITVNFGTTTSYGLKTWSQSTTTGGPVSILVAGMLASTTYHMQASVSLANGVTGADSDHTFTTGAIPANLKFASLTAGAATGMTPQPGVELLSSVTGTPGGVIVTDLSGNELWAYATPPVSNVELVTGVDLLPDGNFLMTFGANPPTPVTASNPVPAGSIVEAREVSLAGNIVRSVNVTDLNAALLNATCAECNVNIQNFHHDILQLPNGHWMILGSTSMALSPTSTPALTNLPPATVTGDVIIDVDQDMHPVWVWNEFNHLDPNRHPMMFPDWTHTNAIVYSPDDGNLIVSIRHQNWVLKVDYANGTGSGNILWHLGEGEDFKLVNGTDPTDWQYAQHAPSFVSTNTSGVFSMTMMDNGDDRIFPTGVTCGTSGAPPCLYSTVPIFQIDESAMTATLTFHSILPASEYNFFGGNAEVLANGNVEYDLCARGSAIGTGSDVYEVTNESTPRTVWSMHDSGANLYRARRMPSLYPGVQW
jgi:arylsulfate sulfotransferase